MKLAIPTVAAALLSLTVPLLHAEPNNVSTAASCTNTVLHVTVQNLTGQTQQGYINEGTASPFSVGPKQVRDVTLPASQLRADHRVEIFLSSTSSGYENLDTDDDLSRRCVGDIDLPSGCASDTPAGRLYIYETSHGHQCFIRTVAKLPRAGASAIALRK